jgi:hypothetical protein
VLLSDHTSAEARREPCLLNGGMLIAESDPTKITLGAVGGTGQVVREPFASLIVDRVSPGGTFAATLESEPLANALLALGTPALPFTTPFGGFWLDPAATVVLAFGQLDPGGTWLYRMPVPAQPSLAGLALVSPGFVSTTAGDRLTTPAAFVVH